MNIITLNIICGLPGSGKTTLGRRLCGNNCVSADDYFYDIDGEYNFNPALLPLAHGECQTRVRQKLLNAIDLLDHGICYEVRDVAVANTFTQAWEVDPYRKIVADLQPIAAEAGVEIRIVRIDLFDADCADEELAVRTKHGVPVEAIARMRARYEFSK
jgi:cytidylate kinase